MRRRKNRQRKRAKSEVNVTPLLDVVFIMLIFFVVTASFIRESSIDLGRYDVPASAGSSKSKNIFIALGADEKIWVDRRAVTLDALRPYLAKLHADNPTANVIIITKPTSKTGTLVRVIDIARLTGIEGVSLASG